jgi:prepilin-type N-terminal cleavage/methylation domain-containing protein
MRRQAQSGFTLIELLIAITLVAAISGGMLTALRNALFTMERTQLRLEEARRASGLQTLVRRQIGGAMAARGLCGGANAALTPVFRGNAQRLLLVSTDSLAGAGRGLPRIVLYAVEPNGDGTVRLEATEQPFVGPLSSVPFCQAGAGAALGRPFVIYPRLASARFRYRRMNPDTYVGQGAWLEEWVQPLMPYAVRIDIAPAPGTETRMPVGSITVPLHVTRAPGVQYGD